MSSILRKTQQDAERAFTVRVRIAVPPGGFGRQLLVMRAWLDELCGAAGWASAPAGLNGVVNDAIAFYFNDPAFAQAFVNRFCCGYQPVETNRNHAGAFSLCGDAPSTQRVGVAYKTN